MTGRLTRLMVPALASAIGATGVFVIATAAADAVPDRVLIGLSCAVALLLGLIFERPVAPRELWQRQREDVVWTAVGGAAMLWCAPLLAALQRSSDAPSGADSLFLMTTTWGALLVLASWGLARGRRGPAPLAGVIAALAGAAGLLASWEYPSSFALIAKFPMRDAMLVLAGAVFVAGALVVSAIGSRLPLRTTALVALAGASVPGVIFALPQLPGVVELTQGVLMPCIYLGAALALFTFGWTTLERGTDTLRASATLMSVPLLVMSLAAVEQLTFEYGPSPVAWAGAASGAMALTVGLVVIAMTPVDAESAERSVGGRHAIALAFAGASMITGVVSLFTPALDALSEGGTGEPFRVAWTMVGFESATGWLTLAAAGASLAAVLSARSNDRVSSWGPSAVASVTCVIASVPLRGTTLHTWNTWIPADVQQTYGTEYSRLVVEALVDPVRVAAAVLAVLAVIVLAFSVGFGRSRARALEEAV
ncbi:MAG: hypothetical protein HGB10_10415 [Coriobacteriia bacterium]|nr:hypothetical protein [Coriobacteriia bacterium]